ncbi:hypothetical protein BGX26_006087 [Mortierella sp. AD094]|nr:hypothetical protein BGX26_006087 [Mortierella sp. AD094]
MALSLILASFANQVGEFRIKTLSRLWDVYKKGTFTSFLFGVGASLAYYPTIAVPSHHFIKKRGLATGIAVSGVGAGGPIISAYIGHSELLLFCALLCVEGKNYIDVGQPRNEKPTNDEKYEKHKLDEAGKALEDKPSFFAALKVFKDPRFMSLSLAQFMISPYAVFIGISAERGALILGLLNGASFVGRIMLGLVSDYVSNAKVLLACAWCTAFTVLVLWTVSHSFGLLLLMGLMFGFFAGGYVSLVPVAVAQSFGTKQMASTIGLMYTAGVLGVLRGAPLAGLLLDITQPNTSYLPVTLASGLAMTVGALCISFWAYVDRKVKRAQRATNK